MVDIDSLEFENHCMFNAVKQVKTISNDFLQHYNLTHFSYFRFYDDGTSFSLTTHPEVSIAFFRERFYNTIEYNKATDRIDSAALLWLALSPNDNKLINYVKSHYNLANGLLIIKKQAGFIENYYFATNPDNLYVNNAYLSRLDDFYNFCFYFKEQARKLIIKNHKNRIALPDYEPQVQAVSLNFYPALKQRINIDEPLFKKLYYCPDFTAALSRREFQCLASIALGMQIRDIANKLELKERTVNFYFENIKQKLGLHSRKELIDFYHALF